MATQNCVPLPWNGASRIAPLSKQFRRGERLFRDVQLHSLSVVREGWACRSRVTKDGRRQILGILMPGDVCRPATGGVAWVDYSLVALSAMKVDMRPFEAEEPAALLEHALADVAISARWIARLGQRSAVQKVADLVEELVVRQGLGDAEHIPHAPFLLTQYDLADATGLTAIHVNRTLRDLREVDLLRVKRGEMAIPSMTRLRAAAAGLEAN